MKNINILIIIYLVLTSCQGLKDAGKVLRNEKINSTDEFLVEKKNPLILPPNSEKIPEPGSISKNNMKNEDELKKILNAPKIENTTKKKSSSIEEAILNRIRK